GGDRDDLHLAGGRTVHDPGDPQPRLPGRPGLRVHPGHRGGADQPDRGPAVRLARSAHRRDVIRLARRSPLAGAGALTVGVVAGLVAGYLGGRMDTIIMRLADLNLAFPLILLALAVVALLGANLKNLVIVMAITTWMIYARVVRGLSLGLREREFVQAARA